MKTITSNLSKAFLSALFSALLSSCNKEPKSSSKKEAETSQESVSSTLHKTADYATGKTQLEQKVKITNTLNKIQDEHNQKLEKTLEP